MAVIEKNPLMKYKTKTGDIDVLYPITKAENVNGLGKQIRNQSVTTAGTGSAYTATVDGIESLTAGVSFTMIPNVVSTSSSPSLNVNGLGAKYIRRRVTGSTGTTYSAGTQNDWLAANKPVTVTYDGTVWIADVPVPNASDIMGIVAIKNGGTGAETADTAMINLGIKKADGTIGNSNNCYAEVDMWGDSNPNSENRVGYFVGINNTGNIFKAGTNTIIRGVTVSAASFSTGCADNSAISPAYAYVALIGIVSIIDNGTCTVGGRCMPGTNGTAIPANGSYGYLVVHRIDDAHVQIVLEPGVDYQYRTSKIMATKDYVDDKRISATATITTSWTGSTAPFTQEVTIPGMLDSDTPHIMPVYSTALETALAQKEAWGLVSDAEASAGKIVFKCFEEKPTTAIPIQIEVNR